MGLFSKRLRTRRSLLAAKPSAERSMPLRQRLLIGNVGLFCMVVLITLIDAESISFQTAGALLKKIVLGTVLTALLVNAMILLNHLGRRLIKPYTAERSRFVQAVAEAG